MPLFIMQPFKDFSDVHYHKNETGREWQGEENMTDNNNFLLRSAIVSFSLLQRYFAALDVAKVFEI